MTRDKLVDALLVVSREHPVQRSQRRVALSRGVDLLLDEFLRNLLVQLWGKCIGKEECMAPQALVRGGPDGLFAVAAQKVTANLLDR